MNKSKAVKKLEEEIEKYRGDANWGKVDDLTKQNLGKHKSIEQYIILVSAECKMERFFVDNHQDADVNYILNDSKILQDCLTTFNILIREYSTKHYFIEASLLKVKILYSCGEYATCLSEYEKIKLFNLATESIPIRQLKLIAEAFAINALCLEMKTTTGKIKNTEQHLSNIEIIESFNKSVTLAISLIQLLKSKSISSNTWNVSLQPEIIDLPAVGYIIEKAMQKAPLAYILYQGDLQQGISKSREVLQYIETASIPHIRQTLTRQLAELLLRGVCEHTYFPLDRNDLLNEQSGSSSISKPKIYEGSALYIPEDLLSEILLLLLIGDSMVTREAFVTIKPEYEEERRRRFENATAVYDLLTIALAKYGQFEIIYQTFERAMKFSFDEIHIWRQLALSLIASENYARGYLSLKRCNKIDPNDPTICLQMTKLCYYNLFKTKDGIEWAEKAIDLCKSRSKAFQSRAQLALGVGYSLMVEESKLQAEKINYRQNAMNCFNLASNLDPNNHLALFHIALQHALNRRIGDALKIVSLALKKKPDHLHSLHLLCLLLSAQQKFNESLNVVTAALIDYPDNFSLLFTKSSLQAVTIGFDEALMTCRKMFDLWRKLFEKDLDGQNRGTGLINKYMANVDHKSLIHSQMNELSDRESVLQNQSRCNSPKKCSVSDPKQYGNDSIFDYDNTFLQVPTELYKAGSVRNDSITASKVEAQLSDLASSAGSKIESKSGPSEPWIIQAQIWLHLAELYLEEGLLDEADKCVAEAGVLNPLSHLVAYLRGRLAESRMYFAEAKSFYESALSINSSHVKTYLYLGAVFQSLGQLRMSEKMLRDALNIDPNCLEAWSLLGQVVHDLGDPSDAADCFSTAADLELTKPILPFSILPRLFLD